MDKLHRIDGIKWQVWTTGQGKRLTQPLCPQHHLRLEAVRPLHRNSYGHTVPIGSDDAIALECAEQHTFDLPRKFGEEKKYVIDRIDALFFSKYPVLNLDEEAIVVAKEELKDTDYWVRAKVTDSKSGTRLIVWAGSKNQKNKAQLFIEPELERLSFDQNDSHPNEVFTRLEAKFKKTKSILEDK